MTSPTYNVFQQVFTLSLISNVLFQSKGTMDTLQSEAVSSIQTYLPFSGQSNTPDSSIAPAIGNWEVVWGPMVWKDDPTDASTGPDNTVFVAKATGVSGGGLASDVYVVAIAGTALASSYDLWTEDAGVTHVVDFDKWLSDGTWSVSSAPPAPQIVGPLDILKASNPYIAQGTALGTAALLSNPPPAGSGAVAGGQYLADFLAGVPASASIVFTGHSLGGALAPTLAMVLQQQKWLPSQGTGNGGAFVYPTAGPTPGNPTFADSYNTIFPASSGSGYQVWNALLWNTLDIVPHAWAVSNSTDQRTLGAIDTIYGKLNTELALEVAGLVKAAESKENALLNYTPLQGNSFAGTYQTSFTNIDNQTATVHQPPKSFGEFWLEVLYQHMLAYSAELSITLNMPPLYSNATTEAGSSAF